MIVMLIAKTPENLTMIFTESMRNNLCDLDHAFFCIPMTGNGGGDVDLSKAKADFLFVIDKSDSVDDGIEDEFDFVLHLLYRFKLKNGVNNSAIALATYDSEFKMLVSFQSSLEWSPTKLT